MTEVYKCIRKGEAIKLKDDVITITNGYRLP